MKALVVLLVPAVLFGCTVPQEDLVLIEQARQAGELVARDEAASPATRQAGVDIGANMVTLEEAHGTPEAPIVYSPEAAEAARKESKRVHTEPPGFLSLASKFIPWPWAGEVLLGGYGIFEALRRRKVVRRLTSTYKAVESALGTEEVGVVDRVKASMEAAHKAVGVYKEVKEDLVRLGFAKKDA
jgi:hypothetical protein